MRMKITNKILHEKLKYRLEAYKKEVDYDLKRSFHMKDEDSPEFEIYLLDLGRYVEALIFDCTINRCGSSYWSLIKYGGYKNVEEFNKQIKCQEHWLTDDEWQAIRTYQYYYGREEYAL